MATGRPLPDKDYTPDPESTRKALERVDARFLAGVPPSTQPTITIVLGQPGAGKSTVAAGAVRDMGATGAPVHVDLDRLREFHPKYEQIAAENGIHASYYNHPEAARYADHLLTAAIGNKQNVVWETTGGSLDNITRVIDLAKQNHYGVNVRVVATQPEASAAAVIDRYEKGVNVLGRGRWVDLDFHDHVVKVLPKNLETLGQSSQVDSWGVYKRDGTLMFPAEGPGTAAGAAQTVRNEFVRRLTPDERSEIGNFYRMTIDNLEHNYKFPDPLRPPDYRITIKYRGVTFETLPKNPNIQNAFATADAPATMPPPIVPPAPPPQAPVTAPAEPLAPVLTSTPEAVAARKIAGVKTPPPHDAPPQPPTQHEIVNPDIGRSSFRIDGKFVANGTAVAGAGLSLLGVEQRIASGQLGHDWHGNRTQAAAGSAAFTADAINAAGAVTTAVVRLLPGTVPEAMTGVSRLAGRAALPLAVASTGFDMVAGYQEHDYGRMAGAGGRLGGGIVGGMLVGGTAGLVLGSETGPGAIVAGLVGAVVGGIYGEKAARAAVGKAQDYFKNHNPFHWSSSMAPLPGTHQDVIVPPHVPPQAPEELNARLDPPVPATRRVNTPKHAMGFAENTAGAAAAAAKTQTGKKTLPVPGAGATV